MLSIIDLETALSFGIVVQTAVVIFVILCVSYFMTSGLMQWLYHGGKREAVVIQDRPISKGQIKREIFWSLMSMLQSTVWATALLILWREGVFPKFYLDVFAQPWWHQLLSLVGVIVVYDAMFYWSHRALHHKKLARFHATHHRSRVPTAFSMYCFHPVESFIHHLRLPLVLALFPLNPLLIVIAEGFLSNMINAYGHLNYEPKGLRVLSWLHARSACTGTFHNLHHSNGKGNFGFYSRFWDKRFGTLLSETDKTVNDVQQQWYDTPNQGDVRL